MAKVFASLLRTDNKESFELFDHTGLKHGDIVERNGKRYVFVQYSSADEWSRKVSQRIGA